MQVEGADEDVKEQAQVQIKALKTLLPYEANLKNPQSGLKINLGNSDQTLIEGLVDGMILDSF